MAPFFFWLFFTHSGIAVLSVIIAAGIISFVSQIPRKKRKRKPRPVPEFRLELPRPRPNSRPDITLN